MKLLLTKGWYGKEELISAAPTETQISEVIHAQDWKDFVSVRLEMDESNWLDVSGNISEDGLAVVYAEAGVHHVSNDAPTGISVLEETLIRYLNGDKRFTNIGFSSEFEYQSPIINQVSQEDYRKWKVRFEAFQQDQKHKKRVKKAILFFAVVVIIMSVVKLIEFAYHYDYQFSGYKTALTVGDVTEAEEMQFKGNVMLRITYFFSANGKRYKGYFLEKHAHVLLQKGDYVQVKYAVNDPSISEVVGFMKNDN